jgi:hypothetical protein
MKLGFWKIKVMAGIGNTSPYGMLNQSDHPTQFGHFSRLDHPY